MPAIHGGGSADQGNLVAEDYEDDVAADPRIQMLRDKMEVVEDKRYSAEYHEPDKRSIANAIQIFFKDGTSTERVEIEYPIGHRRRRADGIPLLEAKFEAALKDHYKPDQAKKIVDICSDQQKLEAMKVGEFVKAWVV